MFLDMGDGTGRVPRAVQMQALRFLETYWESGKHIVLRAPVGLGKSMVARIAQRVTDAPIITPYNSLVDQYKKDYAELHRYVGQEHYKCREMPGKCYINIRKFGSKCSACEFTASRRGVAANEHAVFNVASYFQFQKKYGASDLCIVDEAHKVLPMLSSMTEITFNQNVVTRRCNAVGFKDIAQDFGKASYENSVRFVQWLGDWIAVNELYVEKLRGESRPTKKIEDYLEKLEMCLNNFAYNSHNYYCEMRSMPGLGKNLIMAPVKISRSLTRKVIGHSRSILLSATLSKSDIEELLGGEDYVVIDLDSPIPATNRRVNYIPCHEAFALRPLVSPLPMANLLKKIVAHFGHLNTIVHTTYDLASKLADLYPKAITHTPETKPQALAQFINHGGVFLASGCAEGLDLKDDLCRINIITKLQFPNLGVAAVKKRRALIDGERWYLSKTLEHLIQAGGRSTRTENDWSHIIICDPAFPGFFARCLQLDLVPQWFLQSVNQRYSINAREAFFSEEFKVPSKATNNIYAVH